MKRTPSKKNRKLDPIENRFDWVKFSCFARMRVGVSGGPIHGSHQQVLQLFIKHWRRDCESWTVYRHEKGAREDGKIVFKKWNREADMERFRALGRKKAPREWNQETNISERHLPLAGRWVAALERSVEALSIPPIAGAVQPLSRDTEYKLSLWRNRQESQFCWHSTPPKAWRPL